MAAFIAFAIAQITKLFTFYYTENRWDFTRIVGSGGMPSSHTSMVRTAAVRSGHKWPWEGAQQSDRGRPSEAGHISM